ncbi:DUF2306 domain-containing protein [Paremcibacter congregatus]|uniref:DUF2306 domain-containing protein n=1 Tax=Paremcibacter congregatus TaxID=2043170 RepID=A0A2G4YNI4_9PROT|nr:DUF2306 domain-containing protein [Paremcibacter congregatus]PHZ83881.1 hypothetical protein CRD36_16155 [Paremcibacter congregatus]QDE27585.1 DUF2306 domain-containing protein [Paremcibacter congregatus]
MINFNADKTLNAAATFWFLVAVLGQWIFVIYIAAFYGSAAVGGNFEKWNKVLPNGYVDGDPIYNLALATHLSLAFTMHFFGPLQLIPQLRSYAPTFHRWNGRIYIATAFIISLAGLYLTWTKVPFGGDRINITINAIAIMVCAAMAYRYARAYNFKAHRRWAIRLFLVVAGVWFFRIGLMFWLAVNKGPVGFDMQSFQGPFLTFLGLAQTFLPLAVLELYFRAQDSSISIAKWFVSIIIFLFTIMMGIGIFAASMAMWIPRI